MLKQKKETIRRSYEMGWTAEDIAGYYGVPIEEITGILVKTPVSEKTWSHLIPEAIAQ